MNRPVQSNSLVSAPADLHSLMHSLRETQVRWAETPLKLRLQVIDRLRHLIAKHAKALAETSANSRSRPHAEALAAEVIPLADACKFLVRNAESILKPRVHGSRGRPLWLGNVRSEVRRQPLGVVLVIGPGNYPLLLPGVQLIQALAAGNAVMLKPGAGGSACAHLLFELLYAANIPRKLVTLLPETTEAAQTAIAAGPDKVLFTGSTETGREVLAQLAAGVIPSTMELGGCDAVIVREDANMDLVTDALEFGLRLNGGASCIGPKRVFVHISLATELEGRLARRFQQVAGSQPELSRVTPRARDLLQPHVQNALDLGAHVVAGEAADRLKLPLILAGVPRQSSILQSDVFAPCLCLVTVEYDAEAVHLANKIPHALGASVFSRHEKKARQVATQLRAGTVTINDLIVPTADPRLPFGGRGLSGFGVTRGAEGLLDLTVPAVVTITRGTSRPGYQPASEQLANFLTAYIQAAHGTGSGVMQRIGKWARLATLALKMPPQDRRERT